MLASGIETPALLEELENHLRNDILRQTKSGRSEAEALEDRRAEPRAAHRQ